MVLGINWVQLKQPIYGLDEEPLKLDVREAIAVLFAYDRLLAQLQQTLKPSLDGAWVAGEVVNKLLELRLGLHALPFDEVFNCGVKYSLEFAVCVHDAVRDVVGEVMNCAHCRFVAVRIHSG